MFCRWIWQPSIFDTGWRRRIGCLVFVSHVPQKSPIISGFFAERDLQLKASYAFSPCCIMHCSLWVGDWIFGPVTCARFIYRSCHESSAEQVLQNTFAKNTFERFHWACYTPEIHQIQRLKLHGTNSNQTKIWITARYWGIWVSRESLYLMQRAQFLLKELYIYQKCPIFYQKWPISEIPTHFTVHSHAHLWVPYIPSKEPCIPSKEPCIPSKEPCILSNLSCILSKMTYIWSTDTLYSAHACSFMGALIY